MISFLASFSAKFFLDNIRCNWVEKSLFKINLASFCANMILVVGERLPVLLGASMKTSSPPVQTI